MLVVQFAVIHAFAKGSKVEVIQILNHLKELIFSEVDDILLNKKYKNKKLVF